MRVSFISALRAELSRARTREPDGPICLFVLGLTDDGDFPAWEMAAALAPDRAFATSPLHTLVVGAAPLPQLVLTLFRAGERELSNVLRSADAGAVQVVVLKDAVREVKTLRDVEAEEAEHLLRAAPAGRA